MTILVRNLAAVTFMGIGLAACGSGNDGPDPAPPVVTPPPAARLEDGFGANFGTSFRNSPNTDAADPMAGDIIPLTLVVDPVTA